MTVLYILDPKIFVWYNTSPSFSGTFVFLCSNEAVNQVCLLIYKNIFLISACSHVYIIAFSEINKEFFVIVVVLPEIRIPK